MLTAGEGEKVDQAMRARPSKDSGDRTRDAGGSTSIAVIGASCRLPSGVGSAASLWDFLRDGRDAITDVPSERWSEKSLTALQAETGRTGHTHVASCPPAAPPSSYTTRPTTCTVASSTRSSRPFVNSQRVDVGDIFRINMREFPLAPVQPGNGLRRCRSHDRAAFGPWHLLAEREGLS
ncbi:beta-ketoacyl synthase N-terminal-like domain-containing protein [Protofrankia symbiont of Coriaria ruscifolia]|uniref:beta-ketoacyl synthase N-terminal-like domain-containing protein n=1 Tax=Protofrankia symbiont of Coriaria ruscifolia TaxID=1306542 RepID=UPI001041439F